MGRRGLYWFVHNAKYSLGILLFSLHKYVVGDYKQLGEGDFPGAMCCESRACMCWMCVCGPMICMKSARPFIVLGGVSFTIERGSNR